MQRVEAAAARKITGAYCCASTEKVLAIAGIEPLHIKAAAMQARYVARTLINPAAADALMPADWLGAGQNDPNADRLPYTRTARGWNQARDNGYGHRSISDDYTSVLGATASKVGAWVLPQPASIAMSWGAAKSNNDIGDTIERVTLNCAKSAPPDIWKREIELAEIAIDSHRLHT